MSKELTEKWKNGEILSGVYYVLSTEDDIPVACDIDVVSDFMIRDVVAPVPSYDEWDKLKIKNGMLNMDNDELKAHCDDLINTVKDLNRQVERLQKKLAIAKRELRQINRKITSAVSEMSHKALKEIEEVK